MMKDIQAFSRSAFDELRDAGTDTTVLILDSGGAGQQTGKVVNFEWPPEQPPSCTPAMWQTITSLLGACGGDLLIVGGIGRTRVIIALAAVGAAAGLIPPHVPPLVWAAAKSGQMPRVRSASLPFVAELLQA